MLRGYRVYYGVVIFITTIRLAWHLFEGVEPRGGFAWMVLTIFLCFALAVLDVPRRRA